MESSCPASQMRSEYLGIRIFMNFYTSVWGVCKSAPGESAIPHNIHINSPVEDFCYIPAFPKLAAHCNPLGSLQSTEAWVPPPGILFSWSGCSLGTDIVKSCSQEQLRNLQGLVQNENAGLPVQNLLRSSTRWQQSIKLSVGPAEHGTPCDHTGPMKPGLAAQVVLRNSQRWEPGV